jgi:hypothetical protein
MSWFWYLIIPLVVGGGHFLIVHELGKESKLRIWHGSAVLIWYFLIAFSNLRNEYPIFSFNPVDPLITWRMSGITVIVYMVFWIIHDRISQPHGENSD